MKSSGLVKFGQTKKVVKFGFARYLGGILPNMDMGFSFQTAAGCDGNAGDNYVQTCPRPNCS